MQEDSTPPRSRRVYTTKLAMVQDEVIQQYEKGESCASIGRHFNVHESTVWNFLRRIGIPMRTFREANKLAAQKPERRAAISAALKGRPSGASGKTWKLAHRKESPAIRGEKNPQWKGGVTPVHLSIRTSAKYKEWRSAVFLRDNYTCVNCGARSGNGQRVTLNADHIKPFSSHPELRFDVDNGRTLCVECHRKTPTFGVNLLRRS